MTDRIILAILLLIIPSAMIGQCFLSRPVAISPQSSSDLIINVSGLSPDDLAVDQAICAINIEWEHGRQENLRFELISPAGQVVPLIGPGIVSGAASSSNVNWNINFVDCDTPTSPDPGIEPIWNNNQRWEAFTNYIGTYRPHSGCLEDFNMGSANGDWRLNIVNLGTTSGVLIFIEIFFCEGTATCTQCLVDAGDFTTPQIILCEGANQLSRLDSAAVYGTIPSVGTDIRYLVDDASGNISVLHAWSEVQALPEGPIDIRVITTTDENLPAVDAIASLADLQSLLDMSLCLDVSDNILAIRYIDAVHIEEVDLALCQGDTIIVDNIAFTQAIDTAFFPSTAMMCDTLIQLNIEEVILDAEISHNGNPVVCGQRQFLDGSQSMAGLQAQFEWTTNDGNIINGLGAVATVDAGGTYFLELTDRGCSNLDSIVLTALDTFFLFLEQEPPLCFGDSLNIILRDSFDMASGPISLSISDIIGPPGAVTDQLGNLINVTDTGLYTIQSMAGSCMREDTITIIDDTQVLNLTAQVTDTLGCNNQPVNISLTTNVLNPTFSFDGPESIPDGNTNPVVSTAGMYTVTVTDQNQCTATTSVEVISQVNLPSVIIPDLVIPCGRSINLEASVTGNVDSLRWVDPMGMILVGNSPSVTDTGTYRLSVFENQGCNLLDLPVVVTTNGEALFDTVETALIPCETGSLLITNDDPSVLDPTNTIAWRDAAGQIISQEPNLSISEPGAVTFMLTDRNGCIGTRTVMALLEAEQSLIQQIDITLESSNCQSLDSTAVTLTGPVSELSQILFNNEDVGLSSDLLLPDGTYDVTLIDEDGCRLDTMLLLDNEAVAPSISLGPDVTLAPEERYTIPISLIGLDDDNTLIWSDADLLSCNQCLDPNIQLTQDTLIILEIIDVNGCQAIDSLFITIIDDLPPPIASPENTSVYIPTIFQPSLPSPDNQLVMGLNADQYTAYTFYLYDRWGNLVVQSEGSVDNNEILLWDGRFKNQPAEQGVYVYMAKLLLVDGLEDVNSGHITLLR